MADRPVTTLFMIESVDGKISTGDNDELDVDRDFKRIKGIKEGLHQYYELEGKSDFFSLNSGRVMAKIGLNERTLEPTKMERVSFIIIDNKPHLNRNGIEYLAKWVKTLYLVTTNKTHPAHQLKNIYKNIEIIEYMKVVDLSDLLSKMKSKYHADRITIQSGGTLNSYFLRLGLIDHISIVIAPCLIGGTNTQSLIGGESLHSNEDLIKVKALKLKKFEVLKNSYLHIKYDVVNETQVDA
jgi:2,5-diamino-6-(ribosylamino)-4(3H)-pyrimidinone 5'-phosphate reductase